MGLDRDVHGRERDELRGGERRARRDVDASLVLVLLRRESGGVPRCVLPTLARAQLNLLTSDAGHGGTVTINNVQGTGGAHWVALYFANGDSTYRNVTVRCVRQLYSCVAR